MECSKDELESFKDLDSSYNLPGAEIISGLERFTMRLYIANIPLTFASIGKLRWHLFCKNQYEGDNLPPTLNALKFKIYQSHLTTMVFERSTESHPNTPSLLVFGWEEANGKWVQLFRYGPSKICGRKPLKNLKAYDLVKDCLPQILLDHSWILCSKYYHVMTDQLPAPEASIEMSLCRCQKSKYNNRRCVSRQNNLVCTEMCDVCLN